MSDSDTKTVRRRYWSDPVKLIQEVEQRPAIWNPQSPDYKVKKLKEQAWIQIASEVIDDWKQMSRSEKHMAVRVLTKRWNNIRDYHLKSLKAQRRRRYAMADRLAFLRPQIDRTIQIQRHMMSPSENHNIEVLEDSEDSGDRSIKIEALDEERENCITYVDVSEDDIGEQCSLRQETLKYDTTPDRDEDPDLMFLKSLLPDMKKLGDEEKFHFKYSIMKAYMEILEKRNL